jgi:hypothetical protein
MAKQQNTSDAVGLDLEALLHPALAFAHPRIVVQNPDLTLNEKRAILASWASDACAVESAPALRRTASGRTITYDDVIDALRDLDENARNLGMDDRHGRLKRALRRWRPVPQLSRRPKTIRAH